MLRNYYKVTEDFQALPNPKEKRQPCERISVEKGDIVVDVRELDKEFLIGKLLVTQKEVQIPAHFVQELKDDGDIDDVCIDECRDRGCSIDEDCRRKSTISDTSCNRKSLNRIGFKDSSKCKGEQLNGAVNDPRSIEKEEVVLDEIPDEYVPVNSQVVPTAYPKAPPRLKKKCDKARETSRSRESDEGYNSCSHYSGEKPLDSEQKSRTSYYNTPIGADMPAFSSFGGSPQRASSPSIQDADGYEIPSFVQRASVVNGEVATGDEKGVTLKFIYQRKNSNFDEKLPESIPLNGSFRLGSIGENSESIYETWDTELKATSPSNERQKAKRERMFVLLYFGITIALALGLFISLILINKTSALLSFAVAVLLFSFVFVGFLTMGNRCWLCIATLMGPSLFTRNVKIGLCIVICVLLIAEPICNIAGNMKMVVNCMNLQNSSEKTSNIYTTTTNSRVLGESQNAEMLSTRPNFALKKKLANTARSLNDTNNVLEHCEALLLNAWKATISCNYTEENAVHVIENSRPRFGELCRNISLTKRDMLAASYTMNMDVRKIARPEHVFRAVLLQCLPFLLLLILHEAYRYNRDYLANKEMDNVYITGKLKSLDNERKKRGIKNLLFPLRKLEFRSYVLPSSFLQTSQETRQVFNWLIVWISLGSLVLICILLDNSVHDVLSYLTENSLNNCNITFITLNQEIVYCLIIILALLIVGIVFQSYALRCRSRVCSYFYPKKELARGTYLYHKILHDRATFWKACRKRGKLLSESRRTRWRIGVCHKLFLVIPKSVRVFLEKFFIYRCMICNALSFRKTFVCKDTECCATFCYECFIDMGQSCISCRPNSARDSVFTSL